jgi:hypothetical protein
MEIGCEVVNWMDLAEDRVQWWDFEIKVVTVQFL